jgi:hypothetical protein
LGAKENIFAKGAGQENRLTARRANQIDPVQQFTPSAQRRSAQLVGWNARALDSSLRLADFDTNQISISTRKRDKLRLRWVSNRTGGESRNDAAKKRSEAGRWRDHARRRRKRCPSGLFRGRDASLLVLSWPNGQK